MAKGLNLQGLAKACGKSQPSVWQWFNDSDSKPATRMIMADNGGQFFISGAPDERWADIWLRHLLYIPGTEIDMVDIFRRAEAVPGIVEEAIACLPGLRTVWMQLGISHARASDRARLCGLTVIEDRCPKIEFPRYL